MKKINQYCILMISLLVVSCNNPDKEKEQTSSMPIYEDIPYLQDYSIKYNWTQDQDISKVYMDRNGVIQVLSTDGLLRTHDGQFLYPGTLLKDKTYRPLTDKQISGLTLYENQFVYLDDKAVFSNAWAGSLYLSHNLPKAHILAAGSNFDFLISDGKSLQFLSKDKAPWEGAIDDRLLDIRYHADQKTFWILGAHSISSFDATTSTLKTTQQEQQLTALALQGDHLVIGTSNGYFELNPKTVTKVGPLQNKLPVTDITYIETIDDHLWFGSSEGAFKLRDDGKFDYYYGKRWLPNNHVKHISKGNDNSILILTDTGLGQIVFEEMTLFDKAEYYEKQVRDRHIRLGFNASLVDMDNGNIDTGRLSDSDNDGLWTTMYLAGEVFRYAVTQSDDALQNCRESMEAMERLFSINPVPGFPSRSFERSGYIEKLHDPDRWQHSNDPEWDWKSTTSSDEAIGHIFAYGVMAELMDNDLKDRAITLIDTLMSHIVRNDLYMVDYDGKPTTWGKWNPDYVNARPKMVGDRKINSSNIIGMLQTAYHFTGKEKYKEKAFDLMNNHGYLENLMWPMKDVAPAPDDADDWSKMLSESWNHSDDEMYFVGYWGLYNYAFNDTLKTKFKASILDHWEIERPEKEGAWNIMTALTGTSEFDLDEAVWYLKEHPMDMVSWDVKNSHRKDLDFIAPNFREQTTKEVLPPDERKIQRHNGNMFRLDKIGNDGGEEYSAGDIWLLPYWMGRYLGVISEPQPLD
ncbi:hypothetical protein HZY62_10355 [Maribacter polysiphoniae]|uniref:Two component regulator with propeller domain n=1 Tax=Maribacter polysiphoniae TaxID=429344 RepID=A0A316ELE1_9FLAO|nr:hypothetical protein [Maribacter polysiphoniae]MBD1260989.1 hypothetical protein [Maribacter polysiphoniae]PWK23770.1 hypothetical protein LX92_02337 [Maribacter polysiphoniae]